jgi:hypothetical protein
VGLPEPDGVAEGVFVGVADIDAVAETASLSDAVTDGDGVPDLEGVAVDEGEVVGVGDGEGGGQLLDEMMPPAVVAFMVDTTMTPFCSPLEKILKGL